MFLRATKRLAGFAIFISVSIISSTALGGVFDFDHDKYNNSIWKFSHEKFCVLIGSANMDAHREKLGYRPDAGYPSWQLFWLSRIRTIELRGVADVPLTENAQEYVNYIVQTRRKHGLPDLPGHPSAGVTSGMDCTGFVFAPPPDPGPGVVTGPESHIQDSVAETAAVFPEEAAKRGVSGQVDLECDVDLDGHLHGCVIVNESPLGLGFGAAALKLTAKVQMWPATRNGIPVPAKVRRHYYFPIGMLRLRPAS